MTEAGGTYSSRQMTVAGVLVALLLIAILLWQWTQISQLVSKVDSTAAAVASQPWAASLATATKTQGDALAQASTDIGNPNRVRVRKQEGGTHKSAADDISAMLPAADSND